jgi:hypothetical protein
LTPTTTSPNNVYHPPNFQAFTDVGSIGHLALGWFAGSLSGPDALAIFAVFTGYQLSQSSTGESWPRIGGELLEFGLGMAIARFTARRDYR